jgi:hypothetical protein
LGVFVYSVFTIYLEQKEAKTSRSKVTHKNSTFLFASRQLLPCGNAKSEQVGKPA